MDRIDERNLREKIARSIIKRRNIRYVSREEIALRKKQEEELKKAQEILEQLREVTTREEARKREEIEAIIREKERQKSQDSGEDRYAKKYGSQTVLDKDEREKIDKILSEKSEFLYHIIQENLSNNEDLHNEKE